MMILFFVLYTFQLESRPVQERQGIEWTHSLADDTKQHAHTYVRYVRYDEQNN